MAKLVRMPKLSDTMTEGIVVKWHKNIGDEIESGDLLAEIETDKATMEFESFQDGVLLYFGVKEGQTNPVGSILLILGVIGEDISQLLKDEESYKFKTNNYKLFNCKDCDNLVSRSAISCPKCGYQISSVNKNHTLKTNNSSSKFQIDEDDFNDGSLDPNPVQDFFSVTFDILCLGVVIDLIIYFFFLPESERDSAWAMIESIRDNQEIGFVGKLIFYLLITILPFIALWNYLFG